MRLVILISLFVSTYVWSFSLKYVSQYPDHSSVQWAIDNQGVTHDDNHWYISQRYYIWKIHKSLPLAKVVNTRHPKVRKIGIPNHLRKRHYNHFGDITYYEGLIYVPLEGKRPSNGEVPNLLLTYDANTLNLIGEYVLPHAQVSFSWVAVNPVDNLIYTSEFNPMKKGGILVYKISGNSLTLVKKIMPTDSRNRMPSYIKRVQGGVFDEVSNLLMLSCDHEDGGVIGLDMTTFKVKFRQKVKYVPGFPKYEELEGITVWRDSNAPKIKGDVHLMMLDNDLSNKDDIYMKHFELHDRVKANN